MDSQTAIQEWGQSLGILDDAGLGALPFQDSVLDSHPVKTRAGLYVYLNSMLHDRPCFEDAAVIEFLNARYKDDVHNLVGDLVLASFDVLANAMYRNEPTRLINILRSFLVNKLPVFIGNNFATLMPASTVEYLIRQALLRVDSSAFPSLNSMFDPLGKNSLLSEARQDFLFACALHQLIPERSIEEILGDVPMQSLPAAGKYLKDELVRQCTANPTKIDEYIAELEDMEGNAGEIAGAIIDILHTLCANNDTMTLKNVCNALCRKSATLDVIMLFTRPDNLLQPLCNIVDNWQDHEDQNEYQPVYDEFGSILLFIVIVQHRFKLHRDDLGTENPESFVCKYLRDNPVSKSMDDMTEHENQLLGAWIKSLFVTEGISDELMSMCKPKEFHLLVSTLFDQSVKACQASVLTMDTLRGGFEYLLEPFLLPSLIAGLTWFTHCLWEVNDESKNVDTVLPALQALLKPPSMSHDSCTIHSAVLSVVAKPLADSLNHVQKLHASRPDINPLLAVLNPYTQDRQGTSALNELASWSTTPGGGLLAALRHTIQSLIMWSATSPSSNTMSPPSYTHRQLLDTLRVLGAHALLSSIIDEANETTNTTIALEIITIMIFAASHTSLQYPYIKRQMTLREALQFEFQNVDDLARTDTARASTIVRLQRGVDALVDPKSGPGDVVDVENDILPALMQSGEGMHAANIDDVLGEAEDEIANAQNFLSSGNAALLGLR